MDRQDLSMLKPGEAIDLPEILDNPDKKTLAAFIQQCEGPNDVEMAMKDWKRLYKLVSFIEAHCQEYLQMSKLAGGFLYRGIARNLNRAPIFIGNSSDNRPPRNTAPNIQKIADEYLKIGGFKALRSNSVFCGNIDQASEYGDIYIIFPIDGFDFTWSMNHDDWVISDVDIAPSLRDIYPELGIISPIVRRQTFDPKYEEFYSQLKRILKAIDEFALCAYRCNPDPIKLLKKIYSVFNSYEKLPLPKLTSIAELKKAIMPDLKPKIAAARFIKSNAIMNTRLDVAIQTGHESLIHGKYVAVRYYFNSPDYGSALENYYLNQSE